MDILVVVDTQNDFCNGSLGTKDAIDSVPNIVKKIKECGDAGHLIFTTQDTHTKHYMDTREGKYLPVEHCIIGTPGHEIVPAIKEALSKYEVIELIKYTFGSAQLPDAIKSKIKMMPSGRPKYDLVRTDLKITLIGWCTDICVMANAVLLKTAFPEADIIVDSACCAGVTPETHEAALTVMRSLQIDVV